MIVLIPAYEPGPRFVELLDAINERLPGTRVVVVDDGSGPAYWQFFAAARDRGAEVLSCVENRGKGHALKLGFGHIERHFPDESIVCADSDGQHSARDIEDVALALHEGTSPMVLGIRAFTGMVPLRSRFGNAATRLMFAAATHTRISDTQTGLRAYRPELLGWLQSVEGDRFDYELRLLLAANDADIPIAEVPIATTYLEENASSHFRPVVDSVRIYWPLAKFSVSSLAAFVIDFLCLLAFVAITGNLLVSVVAARLVSASINFLTNRHFVFADREAPLDRSGRRYASLAVVLLGANYILLRVLTAASLSLAVAKVITEASLFVTSYQVQKRLVFITEGKPAQDFTGSSQPPLGRRCGEGPSLASASPSVGSTSQDRTRNDR